MKPELTCNIVQDLLPLYVDQLTSEETNEAIERHLEHCSGCKDHLASMQNPIACPAAPKAEIDYMKKVKRSFKQKNLILASVISIVCIAAVSVFLRFFIVGSPVFFGEAPVDFDWTYDADKKIYSINGYIASAQTSARIKVYEDKKNNQIKVKIYELAPSFFYSTNKFSASVPWDGEKDIVWQGKYNQTPIMNSSVLSLLVSEYKNGGFQDSINVFDMAGAQMIKDLYEHAEAVSNAILSKSFDEIPQQYERYYMILLPNASGKFTRWVTDEADLLQEELDDRIFLYQDNDEYYFYKQGEPLKRASKQEVEKIQQYMQVNLSAQHE